ncbi:hypothetical protein V2W45_1479249 [Cenococcum geophilum]
MCSELGQRCFTTYHIVSKHSLGSVYKESLIIPREFRWSLYHLLQSTHNGHFVYILDVIGMVFAGKRFVYPSLIVTINGEKATSYLENWSQFRSLQDRDALYINVFHELAQVSLGTPGSGMGTFTGGGRDRWLYPGTTMELGFVNGTKVTYMDFAKLPIPFTGITSGDQNAATSNTTPTTSSAAASTPAPGYPSPVALQINNLIGGYYFEGDEYSNVAVPSVPSFVSLDSAEISFQAVGKQFISTAKAAGKTRCQREWRRSYLFENTNLIGKKYPEVAGQVPRTLDTSNATLTEIESDIVSSAFNSRTDVNINYKNFPSWAAKFGLQHYYGDNPTNIIRWNLFDRQHLHPGCGSLTNVTRPFAAEDVVIVTDGYCASTCTTFSELMRQQAGIKTIAMGGRSRHEISQAVGGVKGTNDFPWDYIQNLAQEPDEQACYNTTELGDYYNQLPFYRAAIGTVHNVNFRDGIRHGDTSADQIPLQFVYEPADCWILYTKCIAGSVATDTTGGYGKHGRGLKRGMRRRAAGKIENYLLDLYMDLYMDLMLSCCRSRKTGDYSAEPRSEALYA